MFRFLDERGEWVGLWVMRSLSPQPKDHIMPSITLALDLEGTLISNAMSQLPRQGLYAFMEGCAQRFERVVIFSAVRPSRTRAILEQLAAHGDVPSWVGAMEIVSWHGAHKDLRFVDAARPEQVWLVDDLEAYVLPAQRHLWWPISPFDAPYPPDEALLMLLEGFDAKLKLLTLGQP